MTDVTFEDLGTDLGFQVTKKMQAADGSPVRVVVAGGVATAFYEDDVSFVVNGLDTLPPADVATVAMSFGDFFRGVVKDLVKGAVGGGGGGSMKCSGSSSTTTNKDGTTTTTTTWSCEPA